MNDSYKINIISENNFIIRDLKETLKSFFKTEINIIPFCTESISNSNKNIHIISLIDNRKIEDLSSFRESCLVFITDNIKTQELIIKAGFDFVSTPFKIESLITKVNFLKKKIVNFSHPILIGEYHYFTSSSEIYCKDRDLKIKLTQMENNFLKFLANENKSLKKDEILLKVWGYQKKLQTHVLETLVYRIRCKIEKNPKKPKILIFKDNKYFLKKN